MAPSLDAQRDYYNERWKGFQPINVFEASRLLAVLEILTEVLRVEGQQLRICELGCGRGWMTGVAALFGHAVGVDLSESQERASAFPLCHFVTANVLEWENPPEAFDVALSIETIEHVEREHQGDYLAKAGRLLRQGGHLILTTPNRRTMEAMTGGGRSWSNQPIEDWLSKEDLCRLLDKKGFAIRSVGSIVLGFGSIGVYRIINSPRLNWVIRKSSLIGIWRRVLLSRCFGLHLVVHAVRR